MLIAQISDLWTELADSGQILAGLFAVAVAVSAVVAVRAVRDQVRINRFAVYDGFARLVMDVDRVFIEHPEMRQYFYPPGRDQPVPAAPLELARAHAIAEFLADFMDHVATHIDHLDANAWSEWEAYFTELKSSQLLSNFMSDNRDWYCDRLRYVFETQDDGSAAA